MYYVNVTCRDLYGFIGKSRKMQKMYQYICNIFIKDFHVFSRFKVEDRITLTSVLVSFLRGGLPVNKVCVHFFVTQNIAAE